MKFPTWARLQSAASEARSRLHERVLVFRADRGGTPDPRARVLRPEDAPSIALPYSPETVRDNWSNGWVIHAWVENSVPVSFAWVRVARQHRITEVRAQVEADTEVGWIVHCVTPEEFRGRGFYSGLIRAVAAGIAAEHSYIYCAAANLASRKGILKAGYAPVGAITRTLGRLSLSVAELKALPD